MKYTPINCWIVNSAIFETSEITSLPPDFTILKKSILKTGFRGFLIENRGVIEKSNWYDDFLKGLEVKIYIDGSGIYRIVNLDLSENEVYFERLRIPVGYMPWIFYSWQSDHSTTRLEIEIVLKEIIDDINKTRNPKRRIELKNGSEPVTGSGDILDEIKSDIDKSLLVVADITDVAQVVDENKKLVDKWFPNANVIFELSYAFVKKNSDQLILVKKKSEKSSYNQFDLFQNRTEIYTSRDDIKRILSIKICRTLEILGYISILN